MPSRHSRKAKSNIDSYGETNKRTPSQSSAVVTVTDTSAPGKFLFFFSFPSFNNISNIKLQQNINI